eukprot:s307_g2.t1
MAPAEPWRSRPWTHGCPRPILPFPWLLWPPRSIPLRSLLRPLPNHHLLLASLPLPNLVAATSSSLKSHGDLAALGPLAMNCCASSLSNSFGPAGLSAADTAA